MEIYIGKGKGPVLGKLRDLQLIEGDLQLMIRIYLLANGEEIIEKDDRFSKANFRSCKNFSIESVILEKRLILDNSLLLTKHAIYTLTDLQLCYDRQLPNLGSIIQESIGYNRNAMELFTKLIPRW